MILQQQWMNAVKSQNSTVPVSYTHLDVYKRQMFKSSAVHGDPLMNLMIGNDAAAQISVQQDDNSTVKLRMIP